MRFTATVERFGMRTAYRGPPLKTILLRNVRIVGTKKIITDHLWFTAGKWSRELRAGHFFAFDTRVNPYLKGYYDERELDWHLTNPTKIQILGLSDGDNT